MVRELCIIHANCQGDTLHALLASTPTFAQHFEIKKFTNYTHDQVPQETFDRCAVLLYQALGDQWGEYSEAALLERIPSTAQHLKIPNMFFKGYWPLWTNKTHMAYGDTLLEDLAARGHSVPEMLHLCLRGRLAAMYDLDALLSASQAREAAKEAGQVVQTLPLIQEYWRKEQLFHTVNHPGPRLLLHVADGVLGALGLGSVPDGVREALAAQAEEFMQPIHPQVGAHFGLPFAGAQRRYPVYGQEMTYAQYAAAYAACRLLPEDAPTRDFVVYLHLLAKQQGAAA